MLDIKRIRDHADAIKARLALRGAGDEQAIDQILALDEERRKAITEVEQLKSKRNAASKEIGALMGQKKVAEADARKAEVRQIGDRITELDKLVAETEAKQTELLLRVPNVPHESVPTGKTAEDNPEVRTHGEPAKFGFQPKNHRGNTTATCGRFLPGVPSVNCFN